MPHRSLGLWTLLLAVALGACRESTTGADGSDAGSTNPDGGSNPWLDDPGAGGMQIALPEIAVPAGQERTICYFAEVPDLSGSDAAVWFSRWQTALGAHAHELITYRMRTVVTLDGDPGTLVTDGECLNARNWADWPLVANAQQRGETLSDVALPDGVGLSFRPHEKLMMQVRFVNDDASTITEKAGINFYRASKTPTAELGTIRASNRVARACQSNPTPTFSGTCQIDGSGVTVIAANGHMHSRGRQLSMYTWDGTSLERPSDDEQFYESEAWDHPPMSQGLTVALPTNGGVWWSCGYQWTAPTSPLTCETLNSNQQLREPGATPDCCYLSGEEVLRDEQCTVFLYYYPKNDDVNCY